MKKAKFILDLKPTQFSLGMREIEIKYKELRKLKPKKLHRLMEEDPIPVVLSPKGEPHIVDHHHAAYCYWLLGVKEVPIRVEADLTGRKLSFRAFWKRMVSSHWAYLYDQFGDGPRSPVYLPRDIRGMADDPYRSLAWLVRKEGGYENVQETFAEFRWANFFRKRRLLEREGRAALEKCIWPALKLARSSKARRLPGYLGQRMTDLGK